MKYRFKTKEEFIKKFGPAWIDTINDAEKNTWCWATPSMDHLFGTVLEKDFPDDVNDITIKDYSYNTYFITRNMLVEIKSIVPNYKPRKLREI